MTLNDLEEIGVSPYICRMSDINSPEVKVLQLEVEKKYGKRVATSKDFESLSCTVQEYTGEILSSSTLKRLWGYVNLNPKPRITTLDILSRYLDYDDFNGFCEALLQNDTISSGFFNSIALNVSDLKKGAKIQIGWLPNRVVTLEYQGEHHFEVIASQNSKLMVGDKFELTNIVVGYPLYIPSILRNGEQTPAYIVGRDSGISVVKEI